MNRPWQVWSLFGACLLLVVVGMSWLTVKAVELERQQRLMALRADFEGDVRLALRRMDLELAEMFAQETTWPHFAYQSFYLPDTLSASDPFGPPASAVQPPPGKVKSGSKPEPTRPPALQPVASPLLVPSNDFVNLYFQVDAANKAYSPNCPPVDQNDSALRNGMTPQLIEKYKSRLQDFQYLCDTNNLATLVPQVPSMAAPAGQSTLAIASAGNGFPLQQQDQTANQPQQPFLPQPTADTQQVVQSQQGGKPAQYAERISPTEQARRGNREYQTRKRQFDKIVTNWNAAVQQREQLLNNPDIASQQKAFMAGGATNGAAAVEGASKALWIDGQLVLARRLLVDGEPVVQGCWLNWPTIKQHLAAEVADLVPDLDMVPVFDENQADLTRMLATLPAQLIVAVPTLSDVAVGTPLSPIMFSLIAAWVCLSLAAIAAAVLLAGVMALSERRAAFVSAVTHELRTPLTTFRMYAEMLAEGMVPDATRRQQYLDTLKSESDRLFHLVENVLSYARLERGKRAGTLSQVSVRQLLDGMQRGLTQRAEQADMQLVIDVQPQAADRILKTDVHAVEQVMINLVDNACKYAGGGDDRRIHLEARAVDGCVLLQVRDHGPGIARQEMRRLFRPFTKSAQEAAHSAPGVGLGLALCRRIAAQLNGRCYLENAESGGAQFVLKLPAQTA
ncbi:MAG: HAMP domain-containing histidine kinase [Planctomycetota bacterium]|nr:HAMP domain-containing histidine kinase [Planctomycetota bacterium]